MGLKNDVKMGLDNSFFLLTVQWALKYPNSFNSVGDLDDGYSTVRLDFYL